jgi:aryl-alcohol dehydrogenase-like predicted oxidoreductase
LVQIHCGPDEEETIQRGETLEGMLRAKQQGKVRWVGVSCHAGGARVALDKGGYDVLQLPYSILNRAIEKGSDQAEPGEGSILSRAAAAGVGIMAREVLGRGHLTEKVRRMPAEGDPKAARVKALLTKLGTRGVKTPLNQLAVQFALRSPHVATVLVGTRNARHLEDAVVATRDPWNPSLIREIDSLET